MRCYACEKNYPEQGPQPFWICPECKQERNEHPPLLSMYWSINPREQDGTMEGSDDRQRSDTMIDYTHTTITLACAHADNTRCSIDAYVADNGLCYHKKHFRDHNGPWWSVTHTRSGNTLCAEATQFKNEKQCKAFIVRVAPLADWSAEKPALSEDVKTNIRLDCQSIYNYSEVF